MDEDAGDRTRWSSGPGVVVEVTVAAAAKSELPVVGEQGVGVLGHRRQPGVGVRRRRRGGIGDQGPVEGLAGAAAPGARRIITPVNDASLGLVQVRAIEVLAGVAATPVTGPGRVDTGAADIHPETSATIRTVPDEPLYSATLPLLPTGAITRFGTA